jgi:methylmalonyl-CoA/ethylmalonyl-CoA epimerase
MRKIEHIGIAVKDLEISNGVFENFWRSHINLKVASEGVTTSFKSGPNKIELLAATNQSPLLSLSKKKEIHHIAFDVEDIVAEIARLQKEGFIV